MAGKRIYDLPLLADDISNSTYFPIDNQNENWESAKKVSYSQIKRELQGNIPEQLELTEKKLKYLYELTKGQSWDTELGTSPAYVQTVPQGAKMAAIDKIGGRSIVFNQLVNPSSLRPSASAVGLTLTKDGGKITISGTSTGENNLWLIQSYQLLAGHKYLLHSELTSNEFSIRMQGSTYSYSQNIIYSIATNDTVSIQFFFGANVNCSCVFHPQLYDLTAMFSAGSEPNSFAEFKAIFPNDYYPYNTGEIISAKTNNIATISKNLWDETNNYVEITESLLGKRLTTSMTDSSRLALVKVSTTSGATPVAQQTSVPFSFTVTQSMIGLKVWCIHKTTYTEYTIAELKNSQFQIEIGDTATPYSPYGIISQYPIPQSLLEFLADKGYGWSAGNVYNYIDFENKKYVQNVGQIDLGTLNWNRLANAGNYCFAAQMSNDIGYSLKTLVFTIYIQSKIANVASLTNKSIWNEAYAFYSRNLVIRDDSYSTADAFKSAMNGVLLNYQLTTPIEYNISAYLSDDNLLDVEAGGTLTFEQENNTQLPIYNETEYAINLSEVTP